MKNILNLLFSRLVIVIASLLIQAYVLIMVIWKFSNFFVYFYGIFTLISVVAVLWIINGNSNPAYKIAWIIPIMIFPIFGGFIYLLYGGKKSSKKIKVKMHEIQEKMSQSLKREEEILNELKVQSKTTMNQALYIERYSLCPVYKNTTSQYLTPGERKFECLKEELQKAERYIFLEYFIIEEGLMWNPVLDILKEKVKQGVDVRVIYDDVGCLLTLPYGYDRHLEKMGIKCCVFNPVLPILSTRLNNRDHRKIAVIDGHTAFTGGINIADEYINAIEKHGYWKDSSIVIKGEGVWSFTVMFLSMWNYLRKTDDAYENFKPSNQKTDTFISDGYVQPFSDSPLDNEAVGESVYLNLINTAEDYAYINTPYLILDNEMITALCLAAKRSVDVRIVTPHIGDKWFVHAVTHSNYDVLVENGVKIYEYTPGFDHAKTIVVDDKLAVVGTINLDYRSLYMHFECGVWLYQTKSVLEIKKDFIKTLEQCHFVTLEECKAVKWYKKLGRSILRVFATLM